MSYELEHKAEAAPTRAVQTALASASAPLDHDTREAVEPLFNFDFGQLRIHSSPAADEATEALSANAFTYGNHVVLGSRAGQGTLAHELAHVVQQGGAEASQEPHSVAPLDATEHAAERAADSVLAGRPATLTASAPAGPLRLERQDTKVDPSQRLNTPAGAREYVTGRAAMFADEATRVARGEQMLLSFEWSIRMNRAEFNTGIDLLRMQLDNDPELYEQLRGSYAEVVRAHVNAKAAASKTTPQQVYAMYAKQLWPQAVPNPKANELINAVPDAERRQLRLVRADITVPSVAKHFATEGPRLVVPLPPGMAVRFGPGVPEEKALRSGLTGVGTEILRLSVGNLATVDPTDRISALPENSTITVALDLRRYKGPNGAFRFTHLRHPAPAGRGAAASPPELLVEYLGDPGAEGLNPMAELAATGKFAAAHMKATDFKPMEMHDIDAAVGTVRKPRCARSTVWRLLRMPGARGETAAKYQPTTHTIEVYDNAFTYRDTRVGDLPTGLHHAGVHVVAHEIGHAADRVALRQSMAAADAAGAAVNAAAGTFTSKAQRDTFTGLQAASVAAEGVAAAARSHSGLRNVPDKPPTSDRRPRYTESAGPAGAGKIAFREAALADGNRRLTDYSEAAWEEYFAESFSLYNLAPNELRRLRPRLFDYFNRTFPRGTP